MGRTRAVIVALAVLAASLVGVGLAPAAEAAKKSGEDGRIAFVRTNQVFTMNQWGGDLIKLTHKGKNYRPKWSPDGKRISYIHEADGRTDVWVMRADGKNKRAVTTSGDVTSAGADWSPNGKFLLYAISVQLQGIRSTPPFGAPTPLIGFPTGGECDGDGEIRPVYVDRFAAWSPGGAIGVFNHADCYYDDRIDIYFPDTGEIRLYAASGADCCGYLDWTDLFWGPKNQFGYSERDLGQYGEDVTAPSHIVYPGFRSKDHDTEGAPSPSGKFMALVNTASGKAKIVRAKANGFGRQFLRVGQQPDWQPRP